MTQASQVQGLFRKVYGEVKDLQPVKFTHQDMIPFSTRKRVGESYVEAVVLSNENGITLGGCDAEVIELNPAVAGVVKQAEVKDYQMVLASVIPFQTLSRSADRGEAAFASASKHVTKNNLRSHNNFLELMMLYGQSASLMGYVNYATATYRGVALTNGGGAINGITFTAGVNTTEKAILLAPGEYASGIWSGAEGLLIQQIDATGLVVAEGKVLGSVSQYGYILVDFVPVAATSVTSHRLALLGQVDKMDMIGAVAILENTTTLFNLSTSKYPLWRGTTYNAYQPTTTTPGKLTFAKVMEAINNGIDRGNLDGDVVVTVNPRSWQSLVAEQNALATNKDYDPRMAEAGFRAMRFYHMNGYAEVRPSRHVKEGYAFIWSLEDWSRFGSAAVSFSVPGASELIMPLENQTGFAFRSYSSQCMFCAAPARSVLIKNINDEAAA